MRLKQVTKRITRKSVKIELNKLDSEGKIDLSKLYNGLHFERLVDHIIRDCKSGGYALEDAFNPEMLMFAIKSRHYNWIRPENAPFFDELEYYKTHTMRTDPKPITKEERTKLLEIPLDKLRQQIANRLVTLGKSNYYNNVMKLNERQFYAATELILEGFTNTIYDECFWDKMLIESLISLVLERVN